MPEFQTKHFASSSELNGFGMRYRAVMKRHPFLLFGLPFLAVIVAGSFVLTPATAIRYEKHDRKVRQMTREEELSVRKNARKVDIREEYYVSCFASCSCFHWFYGFLGPSTCRQGGDALLLDGWLTITTEAGGKGSRQLGAETRQEAPW
jgi:cytochrome c oxidase assembly protein subunit 16